MALGNDAVVAELRATRREVSRLRSDLFRVLSGFGVGDPEVLSLSAAGALWGGKSSNAVSKAISRARKASAEGDTSAPSIRSIRGGGIYRSDLEALQRWCADRRDAAAVVRSGALAAHRAAQRNGN